MYLKVLIFRVIISFNRYSMSNISTEFSSLAIRYAVLIFINGYMYSCVFVTNTTRFNLSFCYSLFTLHNHSFTWHLISLKLPSFITLILNILGHLGQRTSCTLFIRFFKTLQSTNKETPNLYIT